MDPSKLLPIKVAAHAIFAAGDGVADRWTFSGTQTGALGPLPATNKPVSVNALVIPRVENQKLAESWVVTTAWA